MDTYRLPAGISVFGALVKNFPQGVEDAFGAIMQQLPDGKNRAYYGISNMDANGKIVYYAMAEEKLEGEVAQFGYEKYTIEKGDYLTVPVHNWRTQTDCIKDVFHTMMLDKRADNTKPCVEWYKSDDEMICMLQVDPVKELFAAIDNVAAELLGLLQPLSEQQLNTVPFKDSWTAAQLATHVTKSNNGMVQALDMEGSTVARKADDRVKELKDNFLNYTIKMKSPEFIVPEPGVYEKGKLIASLEKSNQKVKERAGKANLNDMINLPAAFGEITKLELFHFVLYHTTRHVHQLKKIIANI